MQKPKVKKPMARTYNVKSPLFSQQFTSARTFEKAQMYKIKVDAIKAKVLQRYNSRVILNACSKLKSLALVNNSRFYN